MMWEGEAWAPPGGVVDWNCDYTDELNNFVEALVLSCAEVAANSLGSFKQQVYDSVVDHFLDAEEPDDNHNNAWTPYEPTEVDEWNSYDKDC